MSESRDILYLERILESIGRAQKFIGETDFERFAKDEMMLDACLMQLINIGEMAAHLSKEFREQHDHLPWHKAIGMRNQIAHGYFEVEPEEVWRTCQEDLPNLKKQLHAILG